MVQISVSMSCSPTFALEVLSRAGMWPKFSVIAFLTFTSFMPRAIQWHHGAMYRGASSSISPIELMTS